MMKRLVIAAMVLAVQPTLCADFAEDFQAARKLFDGKDYAGAGQAFEKLAADAPNDRGKEAALSMAARSAGRLEQVDRALGLAKSIPDEALSDYTQMEILSDHRRHQALVDAFQDEEIGAWPDRINYNGFFLRGGAYSILGKREAAARDFQRCAELAGSDVAVKLEALNKGAEAERALGNDVGALETYGKALAVFDAEPDRRGTWLHPQTILGLAGILIGQNKCEEARQTLDRCPVKPEPDKRGPWDFLVIEAYGDLHAARGEKQAALARYREAAAIDTHQSYVERVRKKIAGLEPAPSE